MRRRLLTVVFAATAFTTHAAPSGASCMDAVEWRGQLYTGHGDERARPGAPLGDRARLPTSCGPVTITLGKRRTPLKPDVMRWGVVHSIIGVPPTVAVLRDGKVYRNVAPLKALPWSFTA
jgi:hypothetical protein